MNLKFPKVSIYKFNLRNAPHTSSTRCRTWKKTHSKNNAQHVEDRPEMKNIWGRSLWRNRLRRTIIASCLVQSSRPKWTWTQQTMESLARVIRRKVIRTEGKRAKQLVFFLISLCVFSYISVIALFCSNQKCGHCKQIGANIGCYCDIGSDTVLKFCSRKYHVDCGMAHLASFTVTTNCDPVSLCFGHHDAIERCV